MYRIKVSRSSGKHYANIQLEIEVMIPIFQVYLPNLVFCEKLRLFNFFSFSQEIHRFRDMEDFILRIAIMEFF